MTTWLTARELAGLAGMPSTEYRTRGRLEKLKVPSRPRTGRGGGVEYDCSALPEETRQALMLSRLDQARTAIAAPAEASPITQTTPLVATTTTALAKVAPGRRPPSVAEKACADARLILVTELLSLAQYQGTSRACQMLALQLLSEQCSESLQEAARVANKRARSAAVGERTLYRWMSAYQAEGWWGLLPAALPQEALKSLDDDVAAVLSLYHTKDAAFRNLSDAAKYVTKQLARDFDTWHALYKRAWRALSKVDNITLIKARHSGRDRAALLPFKRRDTGSLKPLDVCLVDGHTFKAKVRHPDHGAPFAPEVTLVIDAATRMVCGWSVALSENTIAVGDALRHAVGNVGVFAIIYSDNGPGESAKVFDCPVDGIVRRLGGDHRTGIPGHPQGHGLIERSWQTHMIAVARRFGSYQGQDVDAGTFRKVKAELEKEQRAVRRAEATGEVIALSGKAPSWKQFIEAVEAGVEEYNNTHRHGSLPKRADGKRMTPAEAWKHMLDRDLQVRMDTAELRMAFMPSTVRTAQRGEVVLWNNFYQASELMDRQVDGKQVSVRYDIHDPSYVMVYTTEGRFVCEAKWNANRIDYMPKAVVQMAREKRARTRIKRREDQIDLALRELSSPLQATAVALPHAPAELLTPSLDALVVDAAATVPAGLARPFFSTQSDRYEWLMARRGDWTDEDGQWLRSYARGEDYEALADYYASRGLAWSASAAEEGAQEPGAAGSQASR